LAAASTKKKEKEKPKPVAKALPPAKKDIKETPKAMLQSTKPTPEPVQEPSNQSSNSEEKSVEISAETHTEEQPKSNYIPEDGDVVIRFNHYKNKFKIVGGALTAEAINDEYAILFAYPKSRLRLSQISPHEIKGAAEEAQKPIDFFLEKERPVGTFQELHADLEYWVIIEEDDEEKRMYEERQVLDHVYVDTVHGINT
jgi:hypothetical protein